MATYNDFGGLIDALHEAALEPAMWQSALARLGAAVGDSGVVVLSAYDPSSGGHLLESVGYDLEFWDRVQTEHGHCQPNRQQNEFAQLPSVNRGIPFRAMHPRRGPSSKKVTSGCGGRP
jgi:hypothetical protein